MIRSHYLQGWPAVVVLVLGMKHATKLVGVVVFSLPPRETSLRYKAVTWELARLWIDDSIPRNSETWLLGKAVKYVRREHPEVEALVSYADPSAGHCGTIYRAANWASDGRTDEGRKTPRCDYVEPLTGKKYARRSHIPSGTSVERVPRISKYRYVLKLRGAGVRHGEAHAGGSGAQVPGAAMVRPAALQGTSTVNVSDGSCRNMT
jgi:hypothetical protein